MRYFALLALLASSASAAPALRASTPATCTPSSTSTFTCAFGAAVSAGDFLIACESAGSGGAVNGSVTDSVNGGSWTPQGTQILNNASNAANCFYKENSSSGTPTVSMPMNATVSGIVQVAAFSGIATSSSLITTTGNTDELLGASTSLVSTALTPTASNQAMISMAWCRFNATSITPNNGETELLEDSGHLQQLQWKLTPSTSALSAKWTMGASTECDDIAMIFGALASGGAPSSALGGAVSSIALRGAR